MLNTPKSRAELNRQLGERLRETRLELGLNQLQVAAELGFSSTSTISLIESGRREVSAIELQSFARLYKRGYRYFLKPPQGGEVVETSSTERKSGQFTLGNRVGAGKNQNPKKETA